MKDDLALSVRGLGKRYRRSSGMRLDLLQVRKKTVDYFWALRDISFELKCGTSLGIIGGNGAGKSTLLKVLAKIIPPSEGEAEVFGKVNSLLEVGTGFQSDLSGRANIYLNASILGMSRDETNAVFDEIVEFSGIKEFIDMPVKYYSSGMYSRLAFAVAANVTGDILLIDEVLSVGDAEFRQKCLNRMNNLLIDQKRTVLFVSHSMEAIMRFCSHALWLDHGIGRAFGPADEVVSEYLRSINQLGKNYKTASTIHKDKKPLNNSVHQGGPHKSEYQQVDPTIGFKKILGDSLNHKGDQPGATIHSVTLLDSQGRENDVVARGEHLSIILDCEVLLNNYSIFPVFHLRCAPRAGVPEETHVLTSVQESPLPREIGFYRTEVFLPECFLTTGRYIVSVALVTRAQPLIRHCKLDRVLQFQVIEKSEPHNVFLTEQLHGVIHPTLQWRTRVLDQEESVFIE